jgi:hypothetical protein
MKLFFSLLFLTAAVTGFQHSSNAPIDKMSQFKWLVGTWVTQTNEGKIMETWLPMNDSLYTGQGTLYKKTTETVSLGNMQFQRRNKEYYFTPANATMEYKVVSLSKASFVAENKASENVQKISYILFKKDSLHTIWEGGGKRKDLYYGRVIKASPVKKAK